ncbi:hypothetical protein [Mediterraneibacter gnavus]|jgi:hypothetical protein|uniref:hypothetical protein n=1 Tax=Mediterraneibacter gnavus TaxID=33038 RepID=UPI0036D370E7
MLISEKRRNTPKLSREIMGLLCITAAIALFFFGFLYLTANAIASTYLLENDILLTEGQLLTLQGGDPQPQPIVGGAFISCPVFVSFGAENGLSEGDHSGGGSPAYPSDGFYHAH